MRPAKCANVTRTCKLRGVESPPYRELLDRIGSSRADLLFAALGQPKGKLWLAEHCQALRISASAQIGATLDFLAGKVRRSPRWLQRVGLEWCYRLYQEPKRLASRYASNILFALKMLGLDLLSVFRRSKHKQAGSP